MHSESLNSFMHIHDSLKKEGFTKFVFKNQEPLWQIRKTIESMIQVEPTDLHTLDQSQEEHLNLVKLVTDTVTNSDLVTELLRKNSDLFVSLLGPDLDVQGHSIVRLSRPNVEEDLIGWHRDVFYGASPWELNIWFPIFPLSFGAGLLLAPGTQLIAPKNIREKPDLNQFKGQVTKGSLANQVGYPYLPKTEDLIENLKQEQVELISPQFGEGILFFGCMVHKAQNFSSKTRVSIDTRIKHMQAPSNTKAGYYVPFSRGAVSYCCETYLASMK